MSITHTFHVVESLPGDAAVATRDEEGEIHTYLARTASLEEVAADLSWVFTHLAQCGDYTVKRTG